MNNELNMVYLRLNEEDLPFYYEIIFSARENIVHPHQIKYLQRENALSDIRQGGGIKCVTHSKAVGVVLPIFSPEPLVAALYVMPEYQNKGIGKKLLNMALSWFKDKGATEVYLETDPGSLAEKLYKKLGWQYVGKAEEGIQSRYKIII